MVRSIVAFSLFVSLVPAAAPCYGLTLPEGAVVVATFGPIGRYEGHWGVDVLVPSRTDVRAVGAGTVSFAGSVAGRLSLTIDHGGGIRTSYSYLDDIDVAVGQGVAIGASLGVAGAHGGQGVFHLSLRIGAAYIDPLVLDRCSDVPGPGLWLAAATPGYPTSRDRNPRGHVRPSTHRTSCNGPGCIRAAASR